MPIPYWTLRFCELYVRNFSELIFVTKDLNARRTILQDLSLGKGCDNSNSISISISAFFVSNRSSSCIIPSGAILNNRSS
jgi:hypothetical protein